MIPIAVTIIIAAIAIALLMVGKHKNFAKKYSLPFSILSDTSRKIVTDYGVWREKNTFGKTHLGIVRTTFLINEDGIIEKIINKVETKSHASQIFELYSY